MQFLLDQHYSVGLNIHLSKFVPFIAFADESDRTNAQTNYHAAISALIHFSERFTRFSKKILNSSDTFLTSMGQKVIYFFLIILLAIYETRSPDSDRNFAEKMTQTDLFQPLVSIREKGLIIFSRMFFVYF